MARRIGCNVELSPKALVNRGGDSERKRTLKALLRAPAEKPPSLLSYSQSYRWISVSPLGRSESTTTLAPLRRREWLRQGGFSSTGGCCGISTCQGGGGSPSENTAEPEPGSSPGSGQ